MESQEQINALQAENNMLKEMIKSLTAEKQALDQMYMQSSVEIYKLRTSMNLMQPPVQPVAEPMAELHKDGEVVPLHVEPVEPIAASV